MLKTYLRNVAADMLATFAVFCWFLLAYALARLIVAIFQDWATAVSCGIGGSVLGILLLALTNAVKVWRGRGAATESDSDVA